jgi:hypothetical protein
LTRLSCNRISADCHLVGLTNRETKAVDTQGFKVELCRQRARESATKIGETPLVVEVDEHIQLGCQSAVTLHSIPTRIGQRPIRPVCNASERHGRSLGKTTIRHLGEHLSVGFACAPVRCHDVLMLTRIYAPVSFVVQTCRDTLQRSRFFVDHIACRLATTR